MKRILAAALLLPMLTGCATLERLDSVKSSAEKLLEDSLESAAMAPGDGSLLTVQEAERIALEHTGLTPGQVSRVKTSYDFEDGRHVYEVEFRQGSREHEVKIDASTGQVLAWDMELEDR